MQLIRMTAGYVVMINGGGCRMRGQTARVIGVRGKFLRVGWTPALVGMLLASTALHGALAAPVETGAASVQVAQQGRTVTFAIAAGPLPGVLAAYGQATGFQLLYPSEIAQGVSSPGVTGTLAPKDALARLLAGTGLIARFVDPETVTLEKLPVQTGGAAVLDPVTVQGALSRDPGRSEDTGSYAGGVSSSATKLDLTPRETPQSVSVMTRQRTRTATPSSSRRASPGCSAARWAATETRSSRAASWFPTTR